MRKRRFAALVVIILSAVLMMPVSVSAKTPEIMSSLRSYIGTYGSLNYSAAKGSETYVSRISYQKNKKRFLFECKYSNGSSTSAMKMYMPVSKKKASYTVYFNQTIKAGGKTAKMSGKATLKRKTYNDQTSNLKFSRKNGTSVSKKIKNSTYQNAANILLRTAFRVWEQQLEAGPTISFRNFGFSRISVFDNGIYTKEW